MGKSVPKQGGDLEPIPDRLVVMTFDDGVKSQATFAAPLLRRHGFGGTFFITEGLRFLTHKQYYMTWDEIRQLHEDGFEIGNHLGRHVDVRRQTKKAIRADVEHIEQRCREHGIPVPTTFCYPGSHTSAEAVEVIAEKGYLFARRACEPVTALPDYQRGGNGPPYDPVKDHPFLIPATGHPGPDSTFDECVDAMEQARDGQICVLTFHGVPDLDHPFCSTDPKLYEACVKYLADNDYTVIALRDLVKYVDPHQPFPADFDFSTINWWK